LFVGDVVAVLFRELGVEDWNGGIGPGVMTVVVSGIVREGTECKSIAVEVLGVAEQCEDEVATANVVGEIAKEVAAVRVVAEILDDGAAVGVSVCFFEFFRGGFREALKEQRADAVGPGGIDDGLMCQDGVGANWLRAGEKNR
jgi:hypothetical protein